MTGCRVPQVVKEHRTARLMGGHIMNADDLKKLTTESLKELADLLDQGHSGRLTSLLKTMAWFHRYCHNSTRASSACRIGDTRRTWSRSTTGSAATPAICRNVPM